MKVPNASKLLLKFLPLPYQEVYRLDMKGYSLEKIAEKLNIPSTTAQELHEATIQNIAKLILLLLDTEPQDLPVPLEKVDILKKELAKEGLRLGLNYQSMDSQKETDETLRLQNWKKTLFNKLFKEKD